MSTSPAHTKSALRTRFRAYRSQLSEREYVRRSRAILKHVRWLPELQQAHTVHTYWPVTERREVDTRPLIEHLHRQDVSVVLPVVTEFSGASDGTPAMEHRVYTGPACLTPNRWGLHEPQGTAAVSPEALDLVLVPALGAGRNGHRIGNGGGYYDAFLSEVAAPTVALVYRACLVDTVPAEAHDVPVTYIATEDELLRPASP